MKFTIRRHVFALTTSLFVSSTVFAQAPVQLHWWKPEFIEGQQWAKEVKSQYDRFPARAEQSVPKEVWNLSHHSAGLKISFRTNASTIAVRYIVKGNKSMPHMPSTGVSGVDLYSKDKDGKWQVTFGSYSFGDTVKYQYNNIKTDSFYQTYGREYHLYLPLYNTVSDLEIGVPDSAIIKHLPARTEKPIVVYGTSISQGGCASRPGMAWPAILERRLDRPVINLSFSGAGKLEKEVVDLIKEIDARLFVIDCLPNLTERPGITKEEVIKRVTDGVKSIRKKYQQVPIVLAEHAIDNIAILDTIRNRHYKASSEALQEAVIRLTKDGVKNFYVLKSSEIGLGPDDTVDGLHPNDLGMQLHADAFEKLIRSILHEPTGIISATKPVTQYRDAAIYDWYERHAQILSLNKETPPQVVFIGNSITHYWSGDPATKFARGNASWNRLFKKYTIRNLGFGWDRIENALWRVYHDELDGYQASKVVVLIGTNNLQYNSNAEIIEGLNSLLSAIKWRQPSAEIVLMGLLPRRKLEDRINILNKDIALLADKHKSIFTDPGKSLLIGSGTIEESLFNDGLHPNEAGYQKLAESLSPYFKEKRNRIKSTW